MQKAGAGMGENETQYLYRYISFETFVGMIQSKALTFVLPELWDDPKEGESFEYYVGQTENIYEQMLFWSIYYKTYCQCWTTLAESDAMWRIYSYGNRAIRIRIKHDSVDLLDGVQAIKVEYTDSLECKFQKGLKYYLKSLSQKRTAFEHEKEVRLIKHYQFLNTDDLRRHIDAWCASVGHPKSIDFAEKLFPGQPLEEKSKSISKLLNIGKGARKTIDVSFSHVPDFIAGVLVHPFAPEWYVRIVQEYCTKNKIPFEGKSTLYSRE